MEQTPKEEVITFPNVTMDPPHHDEPKTTRDRRRKRNPGPMHAIKVALYRMGNHFPKSKALPVDDGSKSVWRMLVGSMRPMHLQETQSPHVSPKINNSGFQQQLQAIVPSSSPSEFSIDGRDDGSYSPSPASSRYASAVGLNEMVQGDDEESEIKHENNVVVASLGNDGGDGDEFIDAKAEKFIAQFYSQMKLQRMDSMDRIYRERNQRSLGW